MPRAFRQISPLQHAVHPSYPASLSPLSGVPKNSRERLAEALGDFPITPLHKEHKPKRHPPSRTPATKDLGLSKTHLVYAAIILVLWISVSYLFSFPTFGPFRRRSSSLASVSSSQSAEIHRLFHQLEGRVDQIAKSVELLSTSIQTQGDTVKGASTGMETLEKELRHVMSHTTGALEQLALDARGAVEAVESRIFTLESNLQTVQKRAASQVEEVKGALQHLQKQTVSTGRRTISTDDDGKLLSDLYQKVYLDGTAKIDWARASLGGWVISDFTTRGAGHTWWALVRARIAGSFNRYRAKTPPVSKPVDVVIGGPHSVKTGNGDQLQAGNCFAIQGGAGNITLGLPALIDVTEVRIDHLPPELVPTPETAPARFAVYVDDCTTLPCGNATNFMEPPAVLVGTFDFHYPHLIGESFPLQRPNTDPAESLTSETTDILPIATRRVMFQFLSNHGGPHTCIYRLRVHGTLAKGSTQSS